MMTNGIYIHRNFEGVLPQANLQHVKSCTKEILEKELQMREIASKYDPNLEFRTEGAVRDVQTNSSNVIGQQEEAGGGSVSESMGHIFRETLSTSKLFFLT